MTDNNKNIDTLNGNGTVKRYRQFKPEDVKPKPKVRAPKKKSDVNVKTSDSFEKTADIKD